MPASSSLFALLLLLSGCLSEGASRSLADASDVDTLPQTDSSMEPDAERDSTEPVGGATLTSDQGEEALPGTKVQLGVELSAELEPVITGYRWSVEQPEGSSSRFLPSASERAPTFEAWVVGTYVFHLDLVERVDDQDRIRRAGSYMMIVAPTAALYVELTWRTPGDADETDTGGDANYSAGSDVDLHLMHPSATQFFDWTYDCYWENTNPEWGLFGPTDNPNLDRDDTDGAGPEVISLTSPGVFAYRVGVHYWNDWGYGEAFATVRVYWRGVLVDEWSEVELRFGDLWESHVIDAPTETVTRLTAPGSDAPRITPRYPISPF